eukprot:CAMPEP_0197690442 /NCGR_PEP_ID=MMETSP1338-20131121/108351_1 /TAXON_ID=43686 ORGANISM="Pelagodinium beii, Strain RCC1491" /NCGR_SAMPLE_ID=MMETSP1338 /ASSEMBLY_ACC=CAM_ASM_000754 /LENGTH=135 /DNA_ID=CAMNT_0043272893 /DNA_START=26 /DNA_END=431 /DNA_ORIENTATION=-
MRRNQFRWNNYANAGEIIKVRQNIEIDVWQIFAFGVFQPFQRCLEDSFGKVLQYIGELVRLTTFDSMNLEVIAASLPMPIIVVVVVVVGPLGPGLGGWLPAVPPAAPPGSGAFSALPGPSGPDEASDSARHPCSD